MCGRITSKGKTYRVGQAVPTLAKVEGKIVLASARWAGFAREETVESKWSPYWEAQIQAESYAEHLTPVPGEPRMRIPGGLNIQAVLLQSEHYGRFRPYDVLIVTRPPWDEFSKNMHPRHPELIEAWPMSAVNINLAS